MQISTRHEQHDIAWFTLLHEIGHLVVLALGVVALGWLALAWGCQGAVEAGQEGGHLCAGDWVVW